MTSTEIASTIATFLGGGVLLWIIDWYKKRGKIQINEYSAKIEYYKESHVSYISKIIITIQIINDSGNPVIFRKISAKLYDGQDYHNIRFSAFEVKPAFVLPPMDVKCIDLESIRIRDNALPLPIIAMTDIADFLEVEYVLRGKVDKIFINKRNCEFVDTTLVNMDADY